MLAADIAYHPGPAGTMGSWRNKTTVNGSRGALSRDARSASAPASTGGARRTGPTSRMFEKCATRSRPSMRRRRGAGAPGTSERTHAPVSGCARRCRAHNTPAYEYTWRCLCRSEQHAYARTAVARTGGRAACDAPRDANTNDAPVRARPARAATAAQRGSRHEPSCSPARRSASCAVRPLSLLTITHARVASW